MFNIFPSWTFKCVRVCICFPLRMPCCEGSKSNQEKKLLQHLQSVHWFCSQQVTDLLSVERAVMWRMWSCISSRQPTLCGAGKRVNVDGKINDDPDHISPGFGLMKACTLFIDRKSLFGMMALSTCSYEVRETGIEKLCILFLIQFKHPQCCLNAFIYFCP